MKLWLDAQLPPLLAASINAQVWRIQTPPSTSSDVQARMTTVIRHHPVPAAPFETARETRRP